MVTQPETEFKFKEHFDEAFLDTDADGMSQNDVSLYFMLDTLSEHFDKPNTVAFFRSEEARAVTSKARRMVEAGRPWSEEMNEDTLAKVIFAAIIIGGKTLEAYKDVLINFTDSKTQSIRKKLKPLLQAEYYGINFEEIFAGWLSGNMHRLNEISIRILESLDSTSYQIVRLSTVAQFDYDK